MRLLIFLRRPTGTAAGAKRSGMPNFCGVTKKHDAAGIDKSKRRDYNIYNIYAEKVVLLDVNDRKYVVKGLGQSNIWYGNEEEDRKVETIIENYEKDKINKVTEIEKYTEELEGKEKEAVVKVRINQDKFREKLINKYKKCWTRR